MIYVALNELKFRFYWLLLNGLSGKSFETSSIQLIKSLADTNESDWTPQGPNREADKS